MQNRHTLNLKSAGWLKSLLCLLFAAGCFSLGWPFGGSEAHAQESALRRVGDGPAAGVREVVWLETEYFENIGGWTKDWQFVNQMGSPYLMAIGYGNPVADATTTLKAIKPENYRLWVRTKDWAPQFHPEKFEITFAGKKVPRVFGASGQEGWGWEDGGVHQLQGDVAVALHDLGGYYGRCDVITEYGPRLRSVRTERWCYRRFGTDEALYNHAADPGETVNQVASTKYRSVVERLRAMLESNVVRLSPQ